jgi:SNF2 family DNA or RNA helicase
MAGGEAAGRGALAFTQGIRTEGPFGERPPHQTLLPLYPYQREGMLHLAFKERALLADEMGLGKTIQAIAACLLLHRLGRAARAVDRSLAQPLGRTPT